MLVVLVEEKRGCYKSIFRSLLIFHAFWENYFDNAAICKKFIPNKIIDSIRKTLENCSRFVIITFPIEEFYKPFFGVSYKFFFSWSICNISSRISYIHLLAPFVLADKKHVKSLPSKKNFFV